MARFRLTAILFFVGPFVFADEPWVRHVIDGGSRGADGIRLQDINGDGLPDTVTGWEEGGRIRVCLNPGPARIRDAWPVVVVGQVRSPEDAVFADLDGDGAVDVVSSCEGRERTMFVHWNNSTRQSRRLLDPSAWQTTPLADSQGARQWMYCLPLDIDGRRGIDLVCGSKGPNAEVGWFASPENPRDPKAWRWHTMAAAGWIMSMESIDMDGDGDRDVLLTDRKGPARGCHWLENPGASASTAPWTRHTLGATDREVMFAWVGDIDGDDMDDVVCNVRGKGPVVFRRTSQSPPRWTEFTIPHPGNVGGGKGIALADIDLNGTIDIVCTCEGAKGVVGVFWRSATASPLTPEWDFRDISGSSRGIKFDLIQIVDLDADGDPDVLTCEERDNLGVIWYENPTR